MSKKNDTRVTSQQLSFALYVVFAASLALQVPYALFLRYLRTRRPIPQGKRTFLQRHLRLDKKGDGVFAYHEFGNRINGTINAFNFVFLIGPQMLLTSVVCWGWLLAAVEKWEIHQGPDYGLFAVGLQANPIGTEQITTNFGKMMSALLAVYIFVIVNTILGLTGTMAFVKFVVSKLRSGACFFIGGILFFVAPLATVAFASIISVYDAPVNGHSYKISFEGMLDWITTGGNLGLVPPTDPDSVVDQATRVCVAMYSVTFGGVLLGIIGGYPGCTTFMQFLEGDITTKKEGQRQIHADGGDAQIISAAESSKGGDQAHATSPDIKQLEGIPIESVELQFADKAETAREHLLEVELKQADERFEAIEQELEQTRSELDDVRAQLESTRAELEAMAETREKDLADAWQTALFHRVGEFYCPKCKAGEAVI